MGARQMTRTRTILIAGLLVGALVAAPTRSFAQSDAPADSNAAPAPAAAADAASPAPYKPPLRGAPGGRVGGASRGMVQSDVPWPTIEPIAPADHTGLTALATPTLYFFVSSAVNWPTQLTISAPLQARPVLEVTIPSPPSAGIYIVRLADYRVRLDPGLVYTWSISAVVDPHAWSRNIVGSATIERTAEASPAAGGAAALATAGLWFDAIDAAAGTADRHAALDSLLQQVGLNGAARFDRAGITDPAAVVR